MRIHRLHLIQVSHAALFQDEHLNFLSMSFCLINTLRASLRYIRTSISA